MRFNKLHLARYGHFTDRTLDFPLTAGDEPDIHIVYGRNEAGKSTISNAIMDFLFGIFPRSSYAFIHEQSALEIGADISAGESSLNLIRIKKQLYNTDGVTVDENTLDTHNLAKQDYKSRFWFDNITLHEGGESILNNKGELGAALFAATTGLNTLTDQLDVLMKPTDAFFKPKKRTHIRVFELRNSLKDVQKELKALDTNRASWKRLTKQQQTHLETVETDKANLNTLRIERNRLESLRNSLNRYQQWKNKQRFLEQSSTPLDLPENWVSQFQTLKQEQHGLEKSVRLIASEIETISKSLATSEVFPDWIKNRNTIEQLKSSTELFAKETLKISQLEAQLKNENTGLEQTARDIQSLPIESITQENTLTIEQIVRLDPLMENWNRTNSSATHLTAEQKRIRSRLDEFTSKTQQTNTSAIDNRDHIDRLIRAVEAGNANELIESHKQQTLLLSNLEQEALESRLKLLATGFAPSTDLHSLAAPSSTAIKESVEKRRELKQHVNALIEKEKTIQRSIDGWNTQLQSLGHGTDIDSSSYESSMQNLHQSWEQFCKLIESGENSETLSEHSQKVTKNIDSLEQSIDNRLSAAENIGKVNTVLQSQQKDSGALIEVMNTLSAAQAQLNELSVEQDEQINDLVGLSYADPSALISWREELELWRALDRKRIAQATKLETIAEQCIQQQNALTELIALCTPESGRGTIGNTESLPETLSHAKVVARSADTEWQEHHQFAKKRSELEQELSEKELELNACQEESGRLDADIKQALAATWLNNETAECLAPLWSAVKRHADQINQQSRLNNELKASKSTVDNISQSSAKLAKTLLNEPFEDTDSALSALLAFHDQQTTINTERAQQKIRLAEQQKLLKSEELDIASVDSQLAPMHKRLGTKNMEDLQEKIHHLEGALQAKREQTTIEEDICEQLSVDTFLLARVELDKAMLDLEKQADTEPHSDDNSTQRSQVIRSQMDQHLTSLETDVSSAELTLAESQSALLDVKRQLDRIGLDEKSAVLRQKEADLVHEIEEGVMDALKYRLGLRAIERGLQHFRDTNRSGMLAAAKRSFTAITLNEYTDLVTRPNEKGVEKLIATRNTGESVGAENLSEGTRYQLYLSLRIAAYHEYRQHRTPLPFIADDIFETFDEARTKTALTEFAEMGMHGQIIYFTHHQHVAEIAKTVVPNVNTIQLS